MSYYTEVKTRYVDDVEYQVMIDGYNAHDGGQSDAESEPTYKIEGSEVDLDDCTEEERKYLTELRHVTIDNLTFDFATDYIDRVFEYDY